ncbi:growth arrest and DNA-damage-inducible, beta a isoform X1 [Colossoma macropomum]|uniref:growth arrest and DNA-damage-inducible, beta a isoform X1 n=2 Tax=Colossoma macropomum TaxID=42526 RepID=UPI001863AF44|nr:growth arrest and DNA-damage-inducible, beta a isoform X1 [Colossoma macropomum]
MTLEEVVGCDMADQKMETVSQALEELLVAAQRQDCLTVGVYESAKLMNVDPDSVVLCVLATDEEDEDDIALQIHFTLLQAFCCENDINILRVSGLRRLAQVLGEPSAVDVSGSTGGSSSNSNNNGEPRDFHCILVTVSIDFHLCLLAIFEAELLNCNRREVLGPLSIAYRNTRNSSNLSHVLALSPVNHAGLPRLSLCASC